MIERESERERERDRGREEEREGESALTFDGNLPYGGYHSGHLFSSSQLC